MAMHETDPFETHYAEYDAWFDRNVHAYESELAAVREVLPAPGDWVEIGVGSGRFASRLGVPTGIEPARGIATLARQRGIDVLQGTAEALPLADGSVDAAFLITTLCFVADVDRTFHEAARVLREGGSAIVAFIPKDSPLGALYTDEASCDRFFRRAALYTKQRVFEAIHGAGLDIVRTVQTLTGSPAEMKDRIEPPVDGHDRGSFVVVHARKPSSPSPRPECP